MPPENTHEPATTKNDPAIDHEMQEYIHEKQRERARVEQPAEAERDPAWNNRDHLDPLRTPARETPGADPADAFRQSENGILNQTSTDSGETSTR